MAKKGVITRYFSPACLAKVQNELGFLVARVQNSQDELAMLLRDGYFNIYCRGNSIAKVNVGAHSDYKLEIHPKFVTGTLDSDTRFSSRLKSSGAYLSISLVPEELEFAFHAEYIAKWCGNVKKVGYSEELAFEQKLIADNPPCQEYMIVDRQIADRDWRRAMDLMALRINEDNSYLFEVIEVKMGKNPELLNGEVAGQLQEYVDHLQKHICDYQACYKKNVRQQRLLGLLPGNPDSPLEIGTEVRGVVVACGNSESTKLAVDKLRRKFKNLPLFSVKHFLHDRPKCEL